MCSNNTGLCSIKFRQIQKAIFHCNDLGLTVFREVFREEFKFLDCHWFFHPHWRIQLNLGNMISQGTTMTKMAVLET